MLFTLQNDHGEFVTSFRGNFSGDSGVITCVFAKKLWTASSVGFISTLCMDLSLARGKFQHRAIVIYRGLGSKEMT